MILHKTQGKKVKQKGNIQMQQRKATTKFVRKTLCTESVLITITRLFLSLQIKKKHTAVRQQAVSEDEILYAYDKTKKE